MADPGLIHRYHDGTKHHFSEFARSLGYLDWASQPDPFRTYRGAPRFPLYPRPDADAAGYAPGPCTYGELGVARSPQLMSSAALGDLLRHALGLSAWKQFRDSRWSLRVNPSSGNLHPTGAYVVSAGMSALAPCPAVYHYAPDRHELELRCEFADDAWSAAAGGPLDVILVAFTSIHWRESWKYGERAFRYCQHDLGHAVAALALAAALLGWRGALLPAWPHRAIRTLTGIDRDEDFVDAEREDAGCVVALSPSAIPPAIRDADERLLRGVRMGRWHGHASQLSADHVQWTFIDEIAAATEWDGNAPANPIRAGDQPTPLDRAHPARSRDARALMLQRRSALAFDGRSAADRETFLSMLWSVMPAPRPPWDALWWTPRIHLAIFVHRVQDLPQGLYLLLRSDGALARLRAAFAGDFLWERADAALPLVRLARGDCRRLAARLSCDQDIAADGFFSLGMIAEFDGALAEYGPAFYRHLFWETGVVGQVLYLEAEAAGGRATGIGCFYDDPVHGVLGVKDHACQSLYHFTVGAPVDDRRLTTEPGYAWEQAPSRWRRVDLP
jgi:SagB-type dehydrogenase family enzyme